MYTTEDFKTKKALKDAVKAGTKVTIYQPGGFFNSSVDNGEAFLEGPHYPKPHTWYAKVTMKDGRVIKVT